MIWIGLAASVVIAVAVVLSRPRRPEKDMGSVSSHWIAEHRSDSR